MSGGTFSILRSNRSAAALLAALLVVGIGALSQQQAAARTTITPYIELDQTLIANIKGGDGDVLTYTTAAVGVDGSVTTRRAEAQISLRYEHQFGWNRNTPDQDIISAIARGSYALIPDTLTLDGSALATRARSDGFYGANTMLGNFGGTGAGMIGDVYSFNIGPTLTTRAGDLDVNAAYRFAYTKMDSDFGGGGPDQWNYGPYGDSTIHSLTGSVGMSPGRLPFGWSVSAGYEHEQASELDQRFVNKWVRADGIVPVTPTLALVGGAGYESIRISQDAVLVDEATGFPAVDEDGHYLTDPTAPRQIAYDIDSVMWDAGVLWRPSRRTSLEVRAGRRYASMHYTGSFSWQTSSNGMLQISYMDTVDSFGRGMNRMLNGLPLSFEAMRNPFTGDLTGCVSGSSGTDCFNQALAGITASSYRNRTLLGQYSRREGRLNWGLGLGWTQRTFLAPDTGPLADIDGSRDNYYYGSLFGSYQLDPMSTLSANLYGNYMDTSNDGMNVTNYGAYATYARQFGRRLTGQGSVGVDSVKATDIEQIISLLARIGVRYQF